MTSVDRKRKEDGSQISGKKRVKIGATTTHLINNGTEYAFDNDDEDLETVKKRRGAFNTAGYDSDEEAGGDDSDQDTDEEPQQNSKPSTSDFDDDDMFADTDTKKEPTSDYLSNDQIEGQEWGETAIENGVKLMPFNME